MDVFGKLEKRLIKAKKYERAGILKGIYKQLMEKANGEYREYVRKKTDAESQENNLYDIPLLVLNVIDKLEENKLENHANKLREHYFPYKNEN